MTITTLWILHCALCIVHCALCIVHCALCIIHCALCSASKDRNIGNQSLMIYRGLQVHSCFNLKQIMEFKNLSLHLATKITESDGRYFFKKCFSFLPGRSFLKILRKILSLKPESRLKSSGRFLVEIHGELLETVLYWRRQGSPPPPHSPHTLGLCLKLLSPKERGCGGFDGVVGGVWWSMFAQGEGSSVQHSHPPKRSSSSQRSQSSLTQAQENLSLEEMGFFNV